MFKKGHTPWNKGKSLKGYLERRRLRKLNQKIRNSIKYNVWRDYIKRRDNHTCVVCGNNKGRLEVDHIVSFSYIVKTNSIKTFRQALACKQLWDRDNGRTLCTGCHKNTDTYMKRAK